MKDKENFDAAIEHNLHVARLAPTVGKFFARVTPAFRQFANDVLTDPILTQEQASATVMHVMLEVSINAIARSFGELPSVEVMQKVVEFYSTQIVEDVHERIAAELAEEEA